MRKLIRFGICLKFAGKIFQLRICSRFTGKRKFNNNDTFKIVLAFNVILTGSQISEWLEFEREEDEIASVSNIRRNDVYRCPTAS